MKEVVNVESSGWDEDDDSGSMQLAVDEALETEVDSAGLKD